MPVDQTTVLSQISESSKDLCSRPSMFVVIGSVCRREAMPVITPHLGILRIMTDRTFWQFAFGLLAASLVTCLTVTVTIASMLIAIR